MMLLKWLSILLLSLFFQQDKPQYIGGKHALEKFINEKMIYPTFSQNNCIEGTIYVGFKVDSLGNVYQAYIDKGLGIDLDEEALRLVKLTSGKWELSNRDVSNIQLIIPIKFSMEEKKCNNISSTAVNEAISYYQTQKSLEETVINFYQNKAKGLTRAEEEQDILQLKESLGFNDTYINSEIEEAKKHLQNREKEEACKILNHIKDIGSDAANKLLADFCN
jgi:TonB family protein